MARAKEHCEKLVEENGQVLTESQLIRKLEAENESLKKRISLLSNELQVIKEIAEQALKEE